DPSVGRLDAQHDGSYQGAQLVDRLPNGGALGLRQLAPVPREQPVQRLRCLGVAEQRLERERDVLQRRRRWLEPIGCLELREGPGVVAVLKQLHAVAEVLAPERLLLRLRRSCASVVPRGDERVQRREGDEGGGGAQQAAASAASVPCSRAHAGQGSLVLS